MSLDVAPVHSCGHSRRSHAVLEESEEAGGPGAAAGTCARRAQIAVYEDRVNDEENAVEEEEQHADDRQRKRRSERRHADTAVEVLGKHTDSDQRYDCWNAHRQTTLVR